MMYKRIIVIIVLFSMHVALHGSQQKKLNLDDMSPEIIGLICGHLANQIGTQGFVNEADFPIVMKNINRLASVNKKLQETVHSKDSMNSLIESLAQRFQMEQLDVAAKIKTKAGQAWLKKYVHDSGDYELFASVQKIFSMCREISEQVKPYGVIFDDEQEEPREINPYYCQTKQGLMVTIGTYPDRLCTPWGYVKLFGGGFCSKNLGFEIVSQELFKKITACFEGISDDGCSSSQHTIKHYEQIQEIMVQSTNRRTFKDCFQEISKDEVEARKGQQVLIKSSYCGMNSVYAIKAIGDQQLPEPELRLEKEYGTYEAMRAVWTIMDNEFHGRSEELKEKSASFDIYEEPTRTYPEPYQVVPELYVSTIYQAASQYVQLAARVANQPIFTGITCINGFARVLPCENLYDAKIVEILTKYANNLLLRENRWHFNCFGYSSNQLYLHEQSLGIGLKLWGHKDNKPCDLDILEAKYQEVLHKFQIGWQHEQLIDNQDILHVESEEEWYLFCKHTDLVQEDSFMHVLASKFKLDKKICCHNHWHNEEKHKNEMYLWIRKDAFDKVKDTLGLQLFL